MDISLDGKAIEAVFWPDTESEKGRCLARGPSCGELHLSVTYHGDHDEVWIVQTRDGAEVARHNPRFVESFTWAAEGPKP